QIQNKRLHRTNLYFLLHQKDHTSSPSPPRSRSEQLAKLKGTTAKLSQGVTQHWSVTSVPVVEKRSEIVKSPATLRRQIKIETNAMLEPLSSAIINKSQVTAGTVKDIKETRKENRKAEKNNDTHQDPVNIPECLKPHTVSFKVPKIGQSGLTHRFEASEKIRHTKKEPVTVVERVDYESVDEKDMLLGKSEDNPEFDVKSKKRVFEMGGMNSKIKQDTHTFSKDEFGLTSLENQKRKDTFRNSPYRQPRDTKEGISYKKKQSKCHTDHASGLGRFANTVTESRIATSTSQSADGVQSGFGFKHAPPTYEDVISGHILDISATDSPEELLRNFQKTWQESERVFNSLGYTVSDTSEAEVRSSFHQESAFISETATSGKGNMHTLSKESLSNGMSSCRQANLS
uniref:Uncharacterized protein n=1 Tax=Chelydra serpentina TaxID=8475 RepID=A0A8C3RQ17_CHESE